MNIGELKIKLSADTGEFESGIGMVNAALKSMDEKSGTTVRSMSNIVSDMAEGIKSKSYMISDAGSFVLGALDDNRTEITKDILLSADYMMESLKATFQGYGAEMAYVGEYLGQMIGQGMASKIAESLGNVSLATGEMYASSGQSNSVSNTYNTFKTTYNAAGSANSAVNLADFENRIRRAYA